MPSITRTVDIAAPVEEVFAFFTDPRNLPSIWPGMSEISNVQQHGYGAYSYDWVYLMGWLRFHGSSETTAVEANKRVVVTNKGIPSVFEHIYEDLGGETRLRLLVEYALPAQFASKMIAPIMTRVNERVTDTLLRNLKRRMEKGAGRPLDAAASVTER